MPLLRVKYICMNCGNIFFTTMMKQSEDMAATLTNKASPCPSCGKKVMPVMDIIKPPFWEITKFQGSESRLAMKFLGSEVINMGGNEIFINIDGLLASGFSGNIVLYSNYGEHTEVLDPFHKTVTIGRTLKQGELKAINTGQFERTRGPLVPPLGTHSVAGTMDFANISVIGEPLGAHPMIGVDGDRRRRR